MADTLRGGIVINEILVDPNGATNYDTDGNGTANAIDEFVEIANISNSAIDISGMKLWDAGSGNYFTFPPGTILAPGAHAMVITGLSAGGTLPTGAPNDLFFSAGRGSAVINNGGDNVVLHDPASNEYVIATFNGSPIQNPTTGVGGFSGFPSTATQSGAGENFGNDTDGESLQRTPDGGDTFVSATPTAGVSNVCFVQGSLIGAPDGLIAVESLKVGDWVTTLNHGPQQVKWIYAKSWSSHEIRRMKNLAPVKIQAGAFGNGLPHRDLRISQQHRLLVQGVIAERMFGTAEVLVAAKHLTAMPNIAIDDEAVPISYFHVMFEQHEVIFAEGLPAESLYLGAESLNAVPDDGLRELEFLLGKSIREILETKQTPAHHFAKGRRARTLVNRHIKNAKPLVLLD